MKAPRRILYRRVIFFASLLTALLLCPAISSRASLLVYEGFNYTFGDSLTNSSGQGSGGSFGWGGRWVALNGTTPATNMAASMFYTDAVGNVLVTNGGSVVIGTTGGMTANAQLTRSFNLGTLSGTKYSGLTNSVGTYWSSFIMQWVGPVTAGSPTNQYGRKGVLLFRSLCDTNGGGNGPSLYSVGSPNANNRLGTPYDTWTTWSGGDAGAGVQNTGLAASDITLNAVTFVLMRLDLNGVSGNDTVYTWFNWTNLAVEPLISTASTTNNTVNEDGLNNLRIDANGGNATGTNTVLALDEFRFGSTFADVTPHSSGSVQPPTITAQPANASVTETYPATFSVAVLGTQPLSYQWYFNTNTLLTGQTNISMTIGSVQFSDAGTYHCVVTNAGGGATSEVATLTVVASVLPGIATQPNNQTNAIGFNVTFSVGATGSAPLSYKWYFNTNTPLSGRTNASLSFTIASTSDAGMYSVVVTNKFGSITSSFARLTVSAFGAAQLPAFPGADGAGKLVSGGRGGSVYHVTKLNCALDDPLRNTPGTLLYGLTSVSGARTIVFDVAGVFHLGRMDALDWTSGGNAWDSTSRQGISANNITIAGQTAPGPVIIMGGTLKFSGNNQVLRNVTVAAGYGMKAFWETGTNPPTAGTIPTSYTMDAIEVDAKNIMIDHVDAIYGSDESISCNEIAENFTCQYSLSGLAQNYQDHGFGHLLQPGTDQKLSYIHNLDLHIRSRTPRIGSEVGTGALNDFRNNVNYDWGSGGGYSGAQQPSKNNFINNFYLVGNGGDTSWNGATEAGGSDIFAGSSGYTWAYVSGNLKDTNHDGDPNDTSSADANYTGTIFQPAAYDIDIGVTLSTKESFTNVLNYAGSRWWTRGNGTAADALNQRLVQDVLSGTGRMQAWADDPYDLSGTYVANPANEGAEWRALWALRATNGMAPFNQPAGWDTDGDGMPDTWEIAHGLNPNVANNNGDFDNDGYTDLEEYMNEVAAWPAPGTILFTGDENSRFARIFNWRVYGQQINITNLGNTTTFSFWQPSRYDTAVISNKTVIVDAVGQDVGILRLTNNAAMNITNGWLNVATRFENGTGCTSVVSTAGSLIANNIFNKGTLRLTGAAGLTVSGTFTNTGTLDVMTWSGTLPVGLVNSGVLLDKSLVRISSAATSGTNFVVTMTGYTGHAYQLQYRDSLASGSWQNLGAAVAGADVPINFNHTGGAGAGLRFYRVAISP